MNKFPSVLVAGIFLSVAPALAERSLWQGFHLSYGATLQAGDHDLTLSHERVGSFQVWQLPLSGQGSVVEAGYRWQIGQSSITAGPTFSVMNGSLTGSKTWRHADTGALAKLAYASEIQATAGLELGYIVSERTLLTLEGGMVASDASLALSAGYAGYTAGTDISGYMPGTYVAIGLDHRFKNGAVIEFELGQYELNSADKLGAMSGEVSTKATVASVSYGLEW